MMYNRQFLMQRCDEEHQDVIDRLPSVQGAYYGLDYGNSWLLEGTPIRKQPGSVLFISLIVGYAVLAGPALYLILKKRKKRGRLGVCDS